MSNNNEILPDLMSIGKYLQIGSQEIFVVPAYQRAYSWLSNEQCERLLQDIKEFEESKKEDQYFFGTVILDCSEEHKNELYLIDGQQRTTTFLLIVKALQLQLTKTLRKFKKDPESDALYHGLYHWTTMTFEILFEFKDDFSRVESIKEKWPNNNEINILLNRSNNEEYKEELNCILNAETYDDAKANCFKIKRKKNDNRFTNFFRNFKYFYEELARYSESNLNEFAKTFLTQCQVIVIKTLKEEQAILMFNSLNSTGMPLTDADIISAKLYRNAEDEDMFNNVWHDIIIRSNRLEKEKIIDIDSVLQQYMYIKRAVDHKTINVSTGTADVNTPGIRKFYTDIEKGLLEKPFELCSHFDKIIEIWEKISDFPVVKLLCKFNVNAKIYLISYLYTRFDVDSITEQEVSLISLLLIRLFSIMEIVEVGYSSTYFKVFLFKEIIKLVNPSVEFSEIEEDFNSHINSIIGTAWKKDKLTEYIKNEYEGNILVHLNDFLYSKSKGENFDYSNSVNVEHIMPASGKNISVIRQDAGFDDTEDGRRNFASLVNKIGNKILLEEDINKSIGNSWFKTKKSTSIKDRTGYKDSKYCLAKTLSNYPKDVWDKDDIATATEKASMRITDFMFDGKI